MAMFACLFKGPESLVPAAFSPPEHFPKD